MNCDCMLGWVDFQELIYFLILMLRSFKCIDTSVTKQTPGPEILSKVSDWSLDAGHKF